MNSKSAKPPRPARSPFLVPPQAADADQASRDSRAQWLWQLYASIAPTMPVKIPRSPGETRG
ncbi:hypothetical protein [Hydrocarboniphaga sp.]|uniref:hypothetical protein n=1 Tax=Hydrocarboniphaga sp. TaxID=2033016 RepID=UPI003D1391B4